MNRTGLKLTEARLMGTHADVLVASGLCHVMTIWPAPTIRTTR